MYVDVLLSRMRLCSYFYGGISDEWSKYLSEYLIAPALPAQVVRTVFTDTPFVDMKPAEGHTHGVSAALRSSASLFIDQVAASLGRRVIFYQGSASDVRNGRVISRSTHWIKDTSVAPVEYRPEWDDMVAMVDVDEYVDMPLFLSENYRPVLIYTFQPSNVAKMSGEYKYTFNGDSEVTYTVSGGAKYQHKVWNYDGDSIKIVRKNGWGITIEVSCFSLERRQMDADHQLILLTPMAKYQGDPAWVANCVLEGGELTRLKIAKNGYTRLTTNEADGLKVHTGIVNEYISCTVPAPVDCELRQIAALQSTELTMSQVKSHAQLSDESTPAALWAYLRAKQKPWRGETVSTTVKRVHTYQLVDKYDDYDPDAKPSVIGFMDPIYDSAYAPDMCKSNDKRSVEARVNKVRNETDVTPFTLKVMKEFITMFVGASRHSLEPTGTEEVYVRQDKPQQRRILAEAEYMRYPHRVVKSFMKREAGQNVGDPRNISTINGLDKLEYSTVMYALADFIKQFDWYAFGKSPLEQADRVTEIAQKAKFVIETDFSRMDGRVSPVARMLERMLVMALFKPKHHAKIFELMRAQTDLKAKTKHGVEYQTGTSRLSGSPETSLFNTILNVFVAFLALRMTKVDGRFLTPEEAWAKLGIYGGDDGMSADISSDVYTKAASMMGQKLTCETKQRGSAGIKFLARLYGPEVWFGDNNTMCDLPRTLSKFHTTVHLPKSITDEEKLVDKAYALSLTDTNTPVIGKFVQKVLKHKPEKFEFKNFGRKWLPEERPDKQYPDRPAEWKNDMAEKLMPEFSFGKFNDWINGASTLKELMTCPRMHPTVPPRKLPDTITVVNGDIVEDDEPMPPLVDDSDDDTSKEVVAQEAKPVLPAKTKFRARKKKEDRPSHAREGMPPKKAKIKFQVTPPPVKAKRKPAPTLALTR